MPNPKIPEKIVIHLGSPDSDAMNVTESFADYIKNVASSEIRPGQRKQLKPIFWRKYRWH